MWVDVIMAKVSLISQFSGNQEENAEWRTCQEGSPRLLKDRPGRPDGSPAHWTDACNKMRCTCPLRGEVSAPCCPRLALPLEFSHGSPARSPDLVLHPRQSTPAWQFALSPSHSRPGPELANGALAAPGAPPGPRLPACLSQALCTPDLQAREA